MLVRRTVGRFKSSTLAVAHFLAREAGTVSWNKIRGPTRRRFSITMVTPAASVSSSSATGAVVDKDAAKSGSKMGVEQDKEAIKTGTGRMNRSGAPLSGGYQKTVPIELPQDHGKIDSTSSAQHQHLEDHLASCSSSHRVAPAIEKEHVHAIYDTIASHWSQTRYKAWPKVADFLESLPHGSIVADLGMGNGKNVIASAEFGNIAFMLGTDISGPLVLGCHERVVELKRKGEFGLAGTGTGTTGAAKRRASSQTGGLGAEEEDKVENPRDGNKMQTSFSCDFGVADCVALPLRGGGGSGATTASGAATLYGYGPFDASLLIAVLHHLSTEARRVAALREAMRVLAKGGKLLVYAWAQEQDKTGVSRHVFESQDVLVAWHHKGVLPPKKKKKASQSSTSSQRGAAEAGTEPQEGAEEDSPSSASSKIGAAGNIITTSELPTGSSGTTAPPAPSALAGGPPAHGRIDEEKNAVVYQRYCHVYVEGEVEGLFRNHLADIAEVEEVWMDTGNWCVRAKRI